MSKNKLNISRTELKAAFDSDAYPPVLSLAQVAQMLGRSPKTIYEWVSKGRLDGCFRKRGKSHLFIRDRVIKTVFDGPKWEN